MNDEKFENFLKENKYEQVFNPSNLTPREYFDEEEFGKKYRKSDECLNIFNSISEAYLNRIFNVLIYRCCVLSHI